MAIDWKRSSQRRHRGGHPAIPYQEGRNTAFSLITSSGRAVITAHTDTAGYTNIRVSHKSYGLLYHKRRLEINIKKQMKQKIKWKV